MDSLLASYASSDGEEEEEQQQQEENFSSKTIAKCSEFSFDIRESPKTSSIFSSLPPCRSSTGFSSLPPSKSNRANRQTPIDISSSGPKPKRLVQFKPPINPNLLKPSDEDDDEEEKKRKPSKESTSSTHTSSSKSICSFLPPPKNSLGLGAVPALGAGRRSIVETDVSASNSDAVVLENNEIGADENLGNYEGNWIDGSSSTTSESLISVGDPSGWISGNENYGSHGYYGNYENYAGNNGNSDGSMAMVPETSGMVDGFGMMPRKRGRNEIPTEIVEVKQDELIKNRPREDQVKLTGIAFGPAYKPVSTKGKPSKLHKRKHQIGSLYFDMKQKEMELTERRSRGFLTKAENTSEVWMVN